MRQLRITCSTPECYQGVLVPFGAEPPHTCLNCRKLARLVAQRKKIPQAEAEALVREGCGYCGAVATTTDEEGDPCCDVCRAKVPEALERLGETPAKPAKQPPPAVKELPQELRRRAAERAWLRHVCARG